MQISDLNTKSLTDPAYIAFDDGNRDTYKADFNEIIDDAVAKAFSAADVSGGVVNYTSGDDESPTEWSDVSVLSSGSTLATLLNRISTMIKNVRWLFSRQGTTDISSIGDGTVTGAINSLNGKIAFTSQKVTSFYDSRCENIATAEETYLLRFGNVHIAVICVKMKKTLTSSQTSIITLPSGFNAPANYQPFGIVYNRTTGKMYQVNVSTAGNINILNRGELAIGDNLLGEIVWMA